jgi:DNA polymerase V
MYALVDCNSFYASCEQIFRPDLRGKPVAVLSNNDGCIVARNTEAKALNIPELEPYFKIKKLLAQRQVHVFSSNYELYADISNRVVSTLRDYANHDEVEIYSIDECFLNFDRLTNFDFTDYGQDIKRVLWNEVRMPVCVGVGETKTIAKLANHIAKKSKKLNGVCVIEDIHQWAAVLRKLPVNKVWGIGSRISQRLGYMDINTVYDLVVSDPKAIRKQFGVTVERTVAELNGIRCLNVETQPSNKKEIYSTRSFGQRVHTLNELHESVSQYATTAAAKLRKQGSLVKTVTAFIETSRHAGDQYRNGASMQMLHATNDTSEIISAVRHCVSSVYRPGYAYAKAGVGLIQLIEPNPEQLNIFGEYQSERSKKLMATIDQINMNGKELFFASNGVDQSWKMQRKLKSPSYTTKLDQVVIIKC